MEKLLCKEKVVSYYKIRKASGSEVLKLKNLMFLDQTVNRKYFMVAGGYAAWVAGRTNTYNDVDIFCSERPQGVPRKLLYDEYEHFQVQDYGNYQFVLWNASTPLNYAPPMENELSYFGDILDTFDLDVCRIGYFKVLEAGLIRRKYGMTYYCIERNDNWRKRNLWKHNCPRFTKYSARVKTPFTLFELALNNCLEKDTVGTIRKLNKVCLPYLQFE